MDSSGASGLTRPRRMTQPERRAATQLALVDATVQCLIEFGYAGASAERICEYAGVTRGALVHHFESKDGLVAAAINHLAEQVATRFRAYSADLPAGPDRVVGALDLVWTMFNDDPLFLSTLDLWSVARTDVGLRARLRPLGKALDRNVRKLFADVLAGVADRIPDFANKTDLLLATVRGIAILKLLGADDQVQQSQWRYARTILVPLFAPV
jgi:AcrR family transcriptional regulator